MTHKKTDKRYAGLIRQYKEAYGNVYGTKVDVHWDGRWIRIQGQSSGVSPARLRQLISQLRARE